MQGRSGTAHVRGERSGHGGRTGWWVALALLLATPTLLYPGALPGPRVVSLDDHLSVHHAFQDIPGGVVHNPVLSDPAVQLKAIRRRVVEALSRGYAPLWNPDIFCGAPLLADGQTMVGSPVTWFRLVFPEDTAQDAGVWWLLTWSALGTFLLLKQLGAVPAGALSGALATMTGPFLAVWLQYPLAGSFVWIPWVLLALEHWKHGGSPIWVALAVTGMLGGGHPDPGFYGLALAIGWAAFHRRRLSTALALVIGCLLAAPFWLPLADQAARSVTLGARIGSRLQPAQLLDLLWPGWFGHPAGGGYHGPGAWEDGVIHPGLATLILAGLAWRTPGARRWTGLWLLTVAGAVVGLPGPFHHARLAQYGAWFLALGAGMGVGRLPRKFVWVAPLVVLIAGGWQRRLDRHTLPPEAHDPAPAAWTRVLRQRTGDGRVVGLGWLLQPNTGALAGLRDVRGYDFPVSKAWERFARAIDPDTHPLWYPIQTLTRENMRLLRFAAVRHVLSLDPVAGLDPVDIGTAPLTALALAPEAPRAWLAPRIDLVPDASTALLRLESGLSDRARPPVELPGPDGLPADRPGLSRIASALTYLSAPGRAETHAGAIMPVFVEERRPEEVVLSIEPEQVSLLVVADAWHPGWRVWVDGRPRPLYRVGGYFRGVVVFPGEQTVRMRYEPRGWVWGVRLFLAGVVILATWTSARLVAKKKSHGKKRSRRAAPTCSPAQDGSDRRSNQ